MKFEVKQKRKNNKKINHDKNAEIKSKWDNVGT